MSRVGLGNHLTQLRDGSSQITGHPLCHTETPAAPTRDEPVTDGVGEVASFFGGRAHRDRITRHERPKRLPVQDLAEPPLVAYRAGEADRLGEVRPGHLGVVDRDAAAGSQGPGQQGGVIDFPRDRQGLEGLLHAVGGARIRVERGVVGERPRAHRRRHLGRV